jgi:hypothetical protein
MHVITVWDRNTGLAGMSLTDMPYPHAAERVHAAEITPGGAAVPGPSGRLTDATFGGLS